LDVLSASSIDSKIAWYRNTDGKGSFGPQQRISTQAFGARFVAAADVDGDGDVDVLSASSGDSKIAWYQNTDGKGSFGPQQVITTRADGAASVASADLDGDGDLDVLSASSNDHKIAWYQNTDGKGSFGPQQPISTQAGGAESVAAADMDGDGDLDVLWASSYRDDNTIAWYQNTDGKGSFGPQQVISMRVGWRQFVAAADVDGDGDLDLLLASSFDNTIAWYQNTDGKGNFGPQRRISTRDARAQSVAAADVDGDGDLDVLSASSSYYDGKIVWYQNTDGTGRFGSQKVISTQALGARFVAAADVDGDNDLDVLSTSWSSIDQKIAWYQNTDGKGSFETQQLINMQAGGVQSVAATDVDGDGDLDVLSASFTDNEIAWFQNVDGKGSFGAQQVISTQAGGAYSVAAADVDGDGDVDVLSASFSDNKIAWYQNMDGKGSFGAQQVISMQASGAYSVMAADVDGDGDLDVLSASYHDNTIAWYQNTDGRGSFGSQQVISRQANGAKSVAAADMDGDGDLDVLSASSTSSDNKIAWYQNADGKGSFSPQQVISTQARGAQSLAAADVDGDGNMDVLSASFFYNDNKIAWYQNSDGKASFGPQQVISTQASGTRSVAAADVDGDGDVDVLSASSMSNDHKIAWYQNSNGKGSFGSQQLISTEVIGAESVAAADVDRDGDIDVLSASSIDGQIAWYENLFPRVGDSNRDGVFNSSDLIAVFQAGEYEDGIAGNSSFEEGDWNGDGEFDSGDLVLAFQSGNYVSAAKFAASVDWLLAETKGITSRGASSTEHRIVSDENVDRELDVAFGDVLALTDGLRSTFANGHRDRTGI
jgi:hypothetical protein